MPRKAKAAPPPFEPTYPIVDLYKLKLPWALKDRADFVNNGMVMMEVSKSGIGLALRWRLGLEQIEVVPVALDAITQHGQTNTGQHELDFNMQRKDPAGHLPAARTHLQWLTNKALEFGATPEAIRLFIALGGVSEKEAKIMAEKKVTKKAATAAQGAAAKGDKAAKAAAKDAGSGRKGNPEALAKARAARAEAGPDVRKITIVNKENPYRDGSNRASSFAALTGAKTVEDYKGKGGKVKYLSRWVAEGRIKLA